jgi:murein DD-endopeptidase MepM/ murein hydrolase activator NlpD
MDNNGNFGEEDKGKSSLLEKSVDAGKTIDNLKKASDAKKAVDAAKTAKTAVEVSKTGKLAATLAKLGPALPIILYIVGGFILIVIIAVLFQSVIDSFGIGRGISEDELATNPDYTQLTLDELAIKFSTEDFCGGEDIFEKITTFFNSTTEKIDDICEGSRAINSVIEYYEKEKFKAYNLKLSPGLILSTLVYSYASGEIIDTETGQRIDDSRPMKVLEHIFKNNFITREKIRELVEYMIFNKQYDYYKWDVVETVVNKTDADGNPLNVTKYWSCVKTSAEDHYMSYDKYLINLRFGYEKSSGIYFAGKTYTKGIFEILTGDTLAKTGYEKEKNEMSSWTETPLWCKKADENYVLPTSSDGVTNLPSKDYNKESIDYYKKSIKKDSIEDYISIYEDRVEKLNNYLQVANYEDLEIQDVFEKVYSRDGNNTLGLHNLDYRNGFVYEKFKNFSENTDVYDEKYTPKNIEYSISRILDHEQVFNQILGVETSFLGTGGNEWDGDVNTEWPFFPAGINPGITTGSKSNAVTGCRCKRDDNGNRTVPDFHAAVDLKVPAGTRVFSPLDGTVIQYSPNNDNECGDIVHIKVTIPGTTTQVVFNYTHLTPGSGIKNGSIVKANTTIVGNIWSEETKCSSGPHLDLKIYRYEKPQYYYNPVVFTKALIAGSTNIPYTDYYRGYNNKTDASGYDSSCTSYCR